MPKTSPKLVIDTLAALIAGRSIRGDLPSYGDLARALDASPATIFAAVAELRKRGYVAKHDNGRGHAVTPPTRLRSASLDRLVDELESAAAATNVPFDDVVALLASRMLVRGDWTDERAEQLQLIHSTLERYRELDHRAPKRTSKRELSEHEQAEAARAELYATHAMEARTQPHD